MDYATYYNAASSQPYAFLGMPPTSPFQHTGVDPETMLSVEPLDASYLPTYPFHGLATSQGSPDPAVPPTPMPIGSVDSGFGGEIDENRASRTRSSSEEKDGLTPAQSRRKAQNRAAQRAFRERKERHVKELEAKLTALESSTQNLQSDNERLKLALQRAKTENEILRATSGQHSPTSSSNMSASYPAPMGLMPDDSAENEKYNVQSLTHGTVLNSADKRHGRSQNGREVPAHQVWDLIQSHPMVKQGLVDITDVCERLKGLAKCDGHGPIFEEQVIWRAVEESRRSGGDELI